MSNIVDRWYELQFYQFIKDLQNYHQDPLAVLEAVELVTMYAKLSVNKMQNISLEILHWPNLKPTKEELVILANKANTPIEEIERIAKIERRTIYRIMKRDLANPRVFTPKLPPESIELITKFMAALDRLRKAGIYGSNNLPEATNNAQNPWTSSIYSEPL